MTEGVPPYVDGGRGTPAGPIEPVNDPGGCEPPIGENALWGIGGPIGWKPGGSSVNTMGAEP